MALFFPSRPSFSIAVFVVVVLLWFPQNSLQEDTHDENKLKQNLLINIDLLHNWGLEIQTKFARFEKDIEEWEEAVEELEEYIEDLNEHNEALADEVAIKLDALEEKIWDLEDMIPVATSTPSLSTFANIETTQSRKDWLPLWNTLAPPRELPEAAGISLDAMRNEVDTGTFDHNIPVVMDTINLDTYDGYNISTGKYTVSASGLYTIFLQMGSSDGLPSVFQLVADGIWTESEILLLTTGRDPVSALTTSYLLKEEVLYLRPAAEMDGIEANVKPGFGTRLCLYSLFSFV